MVCSFMAEDLLPWVKGSPWKRTPLDSQLHKLFTFCKHKSAGPGQERRFSAYLGVVFVIPTYEQTGFRPPEAMLFMRCTNLGVVVIQKALLVSLGLLAMSTAALANPRVFLDKRELLLRDLSDESFLPPGLLAKMRAVQVVEADRFQKPLGATRLSAFADPKNRKIYLNEEASFAGDLQTLILHESLIACGLQDTNYEYSLMISLLLKDSKARFLTTEVRAKYVQALKRIPELQMVRYRLKDGSIIDRANGTLVAYGEGGGVVLVGGGGDLRSAQIKERVIARISEVLGQRNPDFYRRHFNTFFLGTKVEAWADPTNSKRVRMTMIYNPQRGIYERIFYVPATVSSDKAVDLIYYAIVNLGALFDNGSELDYFIPRPIERLRWQLERDSFRVRKHQR